jgi:hypothetical protein
MRAGTVQHFTVARLKHEHRFDPLHVDGTEVRGMVVAVIDQAQWR